MKRFGWLFLIFSTGGAMGQGPRVLNLDDCIHIALDRSTAVLKGNNDVALAGTQVLAAYGQFLPNVQAAGGLNYDKGNNWFGSTGVALAGEARGVYNYQLASSVNLFTGYFNRSSLNMAKLNQQISGLSLDRAKQQIELDITQSYLQLVLDRKIVVLDSNNLSVSISREHQLSMLNEVGRTAKTDLYQQQAQTSSDQLLLINARSRSQNDKILLFQKLRIDSVEVYEIADLPIDDEAEAGKYGNIDALVVEGVQQRIDLRSADLNIQANDWNIRKLRSGYLPTVQFPKGKRGR
jgi:outer membrane protein